MSNALHTVNIDTLPWNEFNIFCGRVSQVTTKIIELQSQMVSGSTSYKILIPTAIKRWKGVSMVGKVIALERYTVNNQHRIRKVSI